MFLVQILLPRTPPYDQATGRERFHQTRAELVEEFDGVTAYVRSPAQGVWIAPDGHREDDDVVMVEVMTPTFDRIWWRSYRETLARRFDQQDVMVRALMVEMP
jgi:hypothetical protein